MQMFGEGKAGSRTLHHQTEAVRKMRERLAFSAELLGNYAEKTFERQDGEKFDNFNDKSLLDRCSTCEICHLQQLVRLWASDNVPARSL